MIRDEWSLKCDTTVDIWKPICLKSKKYQQVDTNDKHYLQSTLNLMSGVGDIFGEWNWWLICT